MKGRIVRSLLGIFFVCSLLVLSTTAQEPATMPDSHAIRSAPLPSGVTSLLGSTVTTVWPLSIVYAIDFQYDLCFDVTVVSDDQEYMDRFDVDLPDEWTVVSVYPEAPTGCTAYTREGVEEDNVVYWQINGTIPSGCGPWYGDVQFCARIDVQGCYDAPWSLSWNIIGDEYVGTNEPHQVSGSTDPLDCVPAGLYLDGDNIYDNTCHGVPSYYDLTLTNHTGAEGTFSLEYDVGTNNGTISGPDEIYLGAGVDQVLEVIVTPRGCLGAGQPVEASILAEGNSFDDTSYIHITIGEDGTCPTCTYLPCILKED